MKTLQISKEEAVKFYRTSSPEMKAIFENTFGKETFSEKITDKIRTFDDILDYLGINENFLPYINPKTKEEKSINAQAKIFKIAEVYNEGTVLDWKNTSQYKYLPYKYWSGGDWAGYFNCWSSAADCPLGLFFKTSDLALDAIKKFDDIYNDYLMIQ